MGVRYMQAWEERVKDREEGFENGARDKACQTAHNLYDRGFSAEDTSKIVEESLETVSYTHLDVYKRQLPSCPV